MSMGAATYIELNVPVKIPKPMTQANGLITSPPKISIEITTICVLPWVMIVRDMVRVIALSMTCATDALRILRKFSRIRSNITTDSFTE